MDWHILLYIVYVLVGFCLLLKGGDYLTEGAVSIARIAKLSPMVIGITIVGFGTSSPELLVSIDSALKGISGIAVGNVVGSNIVNICAILGVVSLIYSIPVKSISLRQDLPFMIVAVFLLAVVGLSGNILRWEGFLGFMMLVGYVLFIIRQSRHHPDKDAEASLAAFRQLRLFPAILLIIVSCIALWFGADLLINGASEIARVVGSRLGVEASEMERIIGLTVVAFGTSLPEFFASVMAARKGQADLAFGNIIGSITFNILSVLCIASMICPIHNTNAGGFWVDYVVMVLMSIVLYCFCRLHHALVKWEGVVLVLLYLAYLGYTFIL